MKGVYPIPRNWGVQQEKDYDIFRAMHILFYKIHKDGYASIDRQVANAHWGLQRFDSEVKKILDKYNYFIKNKNVITLNSNVNINNDCYWIPDAYCTGVLTNRFPVNIFHSCKNDTKKFLCLIYTLIQKQGPCDFEKEHEIQKNEMLQAYQSIFGLVKKKSGQKKGSSNFWKPCMAFFNKLISSNMIKKVLEIDNKYLITTGQLMNIKLSDTVILEFPMAAKIDCSINVGSKIYGPGKFETSSLCAYTLFFSSLNNFFDLYSFIESDSFLKVYKFYDPASKVLCRLRKQFLGQSYESKTNRNDINWKEIEIEKLIDFLMHLFFYYGTGNVFNKKDHFIEKYPEILQLWKTPLLAALDLFCMSLGCFFINKSCRPSFVPVIDFPDDKDKAQKNLKELKEKIKIKQGDFIEIRKKNFYHSGFFMPYYSNTCLIMPRQGNFDLYMRFVINGSHLEADEPFKADLQLQRKWNEVVIRNTSTDNKLMLKNATKPLEIFTTIGSDSYINDLGFRFDIDKNIHKWNINFWGVLWNSENEFLRKIPQYKSNPY